MLSERNGIKLKIKKQITKRKLKNSQVFGNQTIHFKNNLWFKKEKVSRETRKYFKGNESKNTPYQNLCYAAKAVLNGKYIALKCID